MFRITFDVPPIIVYAGAYASPCVTSSHNVAYGPNTLDTKSATRASCSVQKHFVAAENPAGACFSTSRITRMRPSV